LWLQKVVRGAMALRRSALKRAVVSEEAAVKRPPVGSPHRSSLAAVPSQAEELSGWVESNPDTAAGILRHWIEQGN
jgi:hypothetical protein